MGNQSNKKKENKIIQYNKNSFNFNRIIGKGGFGRVWRVYDKKTKQPYALKVIDKARVITKKSVQSIMNQRQILSELLDNESNFIVNMHCAFQDRQNCYLLMDYIDGGDLRYYINRNYSFSEEQIKFVVRSLVQGLNHLHMHNIIHRDIKPENILMQKNGYARVTDLGIARYWKSENSHQTSGTPGYMAPQVLIRQNHSFCADFYAVGIIAYELLVGKRPYQGRDRKTIREEVLNRQAKIPAIYHSKMSKEGIDFINKLLQRTAKKRLGYGGLSELLMHPWLYLNNSDRKEFLEQKTKSPIVPLDVVFSHSLQELTEPDEVWRENIFLLKRPEVQKMFEGYDFTLGNQERSSKMEKMSDIMPTQSTIPVRKQNSIW